MPLYEYECDACGGRFEVIQKFSETTEQCRKCGKGPVRRLASSPAIQFKGSGFYITDYAQKGKSESSGDSGSSEKKSDSAKSDSAKSDASKSDASKSDASKSDSGTKSDTAASTPAPPSTTSSKD
jgi:putative FmdB family regulatory protein